MIECKFITIPENMILKNEENCRQKCGRYHNTFFWNIKGYGEKKWMVGC